MRASRKGFTLIELLIVVVIVGILALAAIPLVTSNTRDARRSEGVQMLGSARDFCRAEYSKNGSATNVAAAFTAQIADGSFNGKYYDVIGFSDTSGVAGMDAAVSTNNGADGQGTMDFTWAAGTAQVSWS